MLKNVFEPFGDFIKLKNIDIKNSNKCTNFTYVEGGRDSEISFYFKGSELELISDLSWNRSNNIRLQVDNKVYRYNQQSKDVMSNTTYYKRKLINIKLDDSIHYVKISLDEESLTGKDLKHKFTLDSIRTDGELVDGSNQYKTINVKFIENKLLEGFINSNEDEREQIVFTDKGDIYIIKGKEKIKCTPSNNESMSNLTK